MDDLIGEFIAETRETLDAIGEALIAWEADPADTARLDEIFRFVHTVKGSCGFLDLARIEALAHAAESALSDVRNGDRIADHNLVGVMLRVIDRIATLVDSLDTDAEFPPVDGDLRLIAALADTRGITHEFEPGDGTDQARSRARSVRVAIDLLDAMMSQVSDLVLVRNDLARRVRTARGDSPGEASLDRLSTCVADLRDSVARARMQPVERLFSALPRLVRDTANVLGKNVELVITGSNVELDREMVERLRDPLVHIVRNAVDHGIENADDRRIAGKPPRATILIEARQSGNQIVIAITDDGRGIDCDRLRARATESGLLDHRAAAALGDEAAARLIFLPGISTAADVTAISGRGVGMDIVRTNIEQLGGTVVLDNRPGCGLTTELRAPLTLSIVNVLSVSAGGQAFAIPRAAINEVLALRSRGAVLEPLGDGLVVRIRDKIIPVVSLAQQTGGNAGNPSHLVLIDGGNGHCWALATDAIGDHEEVVIRPVAPIVAASGLFAGQALPDDGVPLLILDMLGLARLAKIGAGQMARQHDQPVAAVPEVSLIVFETSAGVPSAVPVSVVDRIVELPCTSFTVIGQALLVNDNGLVYGIVHETTLPEGHQVPVLRLARGSDRVGLIVGQTQDLIRVPLSEIVSTAAGQIARIGATLVPLLDIDLLFDESREPAPMQAAASRAKAVAA